MSLRPAPSGIRQKPSTASSGSAAVSRMRLPAARWRRATSTRCSASTTKELFFAQAVFGFELASADPRVVAINLVGAEDDYIPMTDYAEHMRMIGFLRTLYPKVRVSLHAGELAPGLVPPEGLCCHVQARRRESPRPIASVMAST